MKNPWTKKNPYLSMWLSGANTIAGTARGKAIAEARRQASSIMTAGTKQMVEMWSGALAPPGKRKRKKRP